MTVVPGTETSKYAGPQVWVWKPQFTLGDLDESSLKKAKHLVDRLQLVDRYCPATQNTSELKAGTDSGETDAC